MMITLVKTQMQLRNMSTPVSTIMMTSHSVSFSREADLHGKNQEDNCQSGNQNISNLRCRRPKGSATDKRELYSDKSVLSHVHLHQRSVRGDGVDEQCAEKALCTGDGFPTLIYRDILQFALSWILLLFPMNRECQAIVCCAPK